MLDVAAAVSATAADSSGAGARDAVPSLSLRLPKIVDDMSHHFTVGADLGAAIYEEIVSIINLADKL